jgi:hypothetical protein
MTIKLKTLRRAAVLSIWAIAFVVWTPAAGTTTGEDAVLTVRFANGVSARVFPSDYLAARTVVESDRGTYWLEGGEYFTFLTDINDPSITNKGDGQFHPFDTDLVLDCLDQIAYPDMDIEIEVFILPYPRVDAISSSASGRRIFLSPHVLEVSREGTAYIIAHELGHIFQYRHFPDGRVDLWDDYRRIRGIENEAKFSNTGQHAYRPREIFAEDFRVLFGGSAAYFGGRVENPDLPSPVTVAGLEEFFLGLTARAAGSRVILSFGSYPNPFNPQTDLRVQLGADFLAAGKPVTVRVYDVTGALVRELFAGSPVGSELRVTWDGCDEKGRQVASSTYFGVVEAGDARMTTKLLMIK